MMQGWLPTVGARTLLDNSEFWPLDRIVPLFPTRSTNSEYGFHSFVGLGTFVGHVPRETHHGHISQLSMLPNGSATARGTCHLLRMFQCCSRSTPDRDSNLDHPVAIIASKPDGESPDDLPSSGSQPEAKPPRRSARKRTIRPFDSSDDDTTPTKGVRCFSVVSCLVVFSILILAWL